MGATVIIDARINFNEVMSRVCLVPPSMDARLAIRIVIDCGHGCQLIPDTIEEAVEFLTLAVKELKSRPDADAVDPHARITEDRPRATETPSVQSTSGAPPDTEPR